MLTVVAVIAAIGHQSSATRPIGEGEVFAQDTAAVSDIAGRSEDLDEAARRARNSLEVEAVSFVDAGGIVIASTSPTLVGHTVSNPLLAFGVNSGRFMALASPIKTPLAIDGVTEWTEGSILYQVISPLEDGGSSLIHYDLSHLLARRSQPGDIQPETLQLAALGVVFALLGGAVMVGHRRATHRYRDMARESDLLKRHSEELESANRQLDKARSEAETALALAEEKMRIRSEFVLMINHELRTPLTSVVTGAQLLRQEGLEGPDASQVLDAMVADGRRLHEIIDQILAVARIENRGLAYELSHVPLTEVYATLKASHPSLGSGKGSNAIPGDTIVKTDPRTLAIVIASLTDNAITHGASNVRLVCGTRRTVNPEISVGEAPESAAFIAVGDDGPGIDPKFLPRIFEKFEKSGFSSGTGLGLYMVRLMVEALEGSVGVKTSSEGTTFEIAIPAVPTHRMAVVR